MIWGYHYFWKPPFDQRFFHGFFHAIKLPFFGTTGILTTSPKFHDHSQQNSEKTAMRLGVSGLLGIVLHISLCIFQCSCWRSQAKPPFRMHIFCWCNSCALTSKNPSPTCGNFNLRQPWRHSHFCIIFRFQPFNFGVVLNFLLRCLASFFLHGLHGVGSFRSFALSQ